MISFVGLPVIAVGAKSFAVSDHPSAPLLLAEHPMPRYQLVVVASERVPSAPLAFSNAQAGPVSLPLLMTSDQPGRISSSLHA